MMVVSAHRDATRLAKNADRRTGSGGAIEEPDVAQHSGVQIRLDRLGRALLHAHS
eukprot:COSAG06_NODE_44_length_29699_cov_231.744527_2_plen_55_part_00